MWLIYQTRHQCKRIEMVLTWLRPVRGLSDYNLTFIWQSPDMNMSLTICKLDFNFCLSSHYIMDVSWVTDDVIYSSWRQRGHKNIIHAVSEIKKNRKSQQVRSKSRKRIFLILVSELVWMWCQSMELIAWKSLWI